MDSWNCVSICALFPDSLEIVGFILKELTVHGRKLSNMKISIIEERAKIKGSKSS